MLRFFIVLVLTLAILAQQGRECVCSVVVTYGGWCDACNVGYIAGLKVPSKALFEALDNHGHDVNRALLPCESCKKAADVDGFCEKCHIGFIDDQAYFSVLTYQLARGKARRLEDITCSTCRKNIEQGGWCEECKVGMLGNVALVDRAGFDQAMPEFRRLRLGLDHLPKCEECALAITFNGMCPTCRIEYHEGKPTLLPPPKVPAATSPK